VAGVGMTDATLITAEQVATINAARTVLEAIAANAYGEHDTQVSGMIYARAAHAAADLFSLLNWVNAYGHAELSKAQLHNEAGDDATRDEPYHYDLDR
jgi:hypothetical protein